MQKVPKQDNQEIGLSDREAGQHLADLRLKHVANVDALVGKEDGCLTRFSRMFVLLVVILTLIGHWAS